MVDIIPQPNKIERHEGQFVLSAATRFCGDFAEEFALLQEEARLYSNTGNENEIETRLKEEMNEEAYRIVISPEKISIFCGGAAGAFYACQTLRQAFGTFLREKKENFPLSCAMIEDSPRYAYRALMLDVARHFFGMEKIKQTLSMMALYKLNVLHLHLTDDQGWRIEIKKYPLLTQKGSVRATTQLNPLKREKDDKPYGKDCFFTQQQMKELIAFAKKLHIEIIPEIDMPGHLVAAISCYPHLSCGRESVDVSENWGILDTVGCCGDDAFLDFAKDVADEICALFPAPYFHIGGDEVPKKKWKTCQACQSKIKEENLADENDLQGYFTAQMGTYLAEKGKRLIGWNEILNSKRIPADTVIAWWTPVGGAKAKAWVNGGGKAILCKWNNFYFDHDYAIRPLKKTYLFEPSNLGIKCEKNVLGLEAPLWTEYVRDERKFDFSLYPRMQALAENAWSSKRDKNYARFKMRLKQSERMMKNNNISYAEEKVADGKTLFVMRTLRAWLRWNKDPYAECKINDKMKGE